MTIRHFCYLTPSLYLFQLLFRLPLKFKLLIYGEYILHLDHQCERGVICSKKMCIYVIRNNMYITLQIFLFIPFSVPFHFPFNVLVTLNIPQSRMNRYIFQPILFTKKYQLRPNLKLSSRFDLQVQTVSWSRSQVFLKYLL